MIEPSCIAYGCLVEPEIGDLWKCAKLVLREVGDR